MNFEAGPAGAHVFSAAMQWLQGMLLGTLATSAAVIAVASVGFLLLSGRIDVRRGAQVILGCFIVFGASTIAAGLMHIAQGENPSQEVAPVAPPPLVAPKPASPPSVKAAPYDPYAGAALPTRP